MKQILIIDDDPILAKVYFNLLQSAGYWVDVANSGEAALELLRYTEPNLILLDLFMRKVNGVQVLKFIRSRTATQKVPVIALSTASTTRLIEAAYEAGANRFMAKDDLDPDGLLDLVRTCLNETRTQEFEEFQAAPPAVDVPTSVNDAQLSASRKLFTPVEQRFGSILRNRFCRASPDLVVRLRQQLRAGLEEDDPPARAELASGIQPILDQFVADAGVAGCCRIEQLGGLLAGALRELHDEKAPLTSDVLETLARAVDLMPVLLEKASERTHRHPVAANVLVADDDPSIGWMIEASLELANFRSIRVRTPGLALQVLNENLFDLIVIDADSAFAKDPEFGAQFRAMPANQYTPALFVIDPAKPPMGRHIARRDEDGTIAQPFRFSELALKALLLVFRRLLQSH